MAISIFGYELRRKSKDVGESLGIKQEVLPSFAAPQTQDGAVEVERFKTDTDNGTGMFASVPYMDLFNYKTDQERILRYRNMALNPDVDEAINYIINDAITVNDTKPPVQLRLDNVDLSEKIKGEIVKEFNNILYLLNFNKDAYEIFRDWYVDSMLYYHPVIDEKKRKDGIKELRRIDPLNLKKVREVIKERDPKTNIDIVKEVREYYVYRQYKRMRGSSANAVQTSNMVSQAIAVAPSAIIAVNSGLLSEDRTTVIGHLHKSIKPLNNLVSVENALVIYRLSRAPERRVFYIDVGNLPKNKAEQYLRDMMNNYRNKMIYDAGTGEVDNMKAHMTMIEDFWLPRRGDKGTQIETLQGGQNLGEIADIEYFQKKLYRSLNVPVSRLDSSTSLINIGRVTEMTRDELKFSKFIDRIRKRFSSLFEQLLRIQLVSKNIMTEGEWDDIREKVQYDFLQDFYLTEQKELDNLRERVAIANEMEVFIGKYFSRDYVRRTVLKQTDIEIAEIDNQIKAERPNELENMALANGGVSPIAGPEGEQQPFEFSEPEGGPDTQMGTSAGNAMLSQVSSAMTNAVNSGRTVGEAKEKVMLDMQLEAIYTDDTGAVIGYKKDGNVYKKQ